MEKIESWKDIKGYEGLYQISNLGRIKSLRRKVRYQNSFKTLKERIKGTFVGKQGYLRVELSKNGVNKKYSVHRLVAKSFIENSNESLEVNHKNGIKADNRVENLEWTTRSENELHAYKMSLAKNTKKQRNAVRLWCKENKIKPIVQLSLEGEFIKEWSSAVEVEKYLKIKRKNISQCITGRNKTAGGFKWITKESYMANCYKVGGEEC